MNLKWVFTLALKAKNLKETYQYLSQQNSRKYTYDKKVNKPWIITILNNAY